MTDPLHARRRRPATSVMPRPADRRARLARSASAWIGALLALALSSAAAPQATAAERLRATYEVSWQGLGIALLETELERQPERYWLSYEIRATGLIGWLFPFWSSGSSEGLRTPAGLQPSRFEGQSRWRSGDRSWTVAFDADGRAIDVEVSLPEPSDREPVPAALEVAPDPLALALEAIEAAAAGLRRGGTSFDGRRVVDFEVACERPEIRMAGADDRPEADLICLIEGRMVAGASRRWRERARSDEEREPVRVWLERGILEGGYWPARLEGESRYGTVQVQMIDLQR